MLEVHVRNWTGIESVPFQFTAAGGIPPQRTSEQGDRRRQESWADFESDPRQHYASNSDPPFLASGRKSLFLGLASGKVMHPSGSFMSPVAPGGGFDNKTCDCRTGAYPSSRPLLYNSGVTRSSGKAGRNEISQD